MLISLGDHPHGGGRGKSKGNRIPVSPWGVPVRVSSVQTVCMLTGVDQERV